MKDRRRDRARAREQRSRWLLSLDLDAEHDNPGGILPESDLRSSPVVDEEPWRLWIMHTQHRWRIVPDRSFSRVMILGRVHPHGCEQWFYTVIVRH